jgi:hypothetical protein
MRFEIPIKVVEERRAEIKALELYCSTNLGKTWELVKTARPDDPSFPFTAPADGTYWFVVIVRDLQGRPEPASPYEAPVGQKILVKTQKPDIQLTAERKGDRVAVRWQVREEYPDLGSFRLEYKSGGEEWIPVQATQALVGQTSFTSPGAVVVRASLADVARNVGLAEARVSGPALSGIVTASAQVPPESGSPSSIGPATTGDGKAYLPPVVPVEGNSTDHKPLSLESIPPLPKESRPAREEVSPPPSRTESGAAPANIVAASPLSETRTAPATTPAASAASAASAPMDAPLQPINTRRLTLEYEVAKYGPSGVRTVDLYVTRDAGVTWQRVAVEHSAGASPNDSRPQETLRRTLSVDLGEDGEYGFSLVVKSGAGRGKPPPRSGDAPQMRVILDTKAPEAKLFRPDPSPSQRNALLITWEASDKNLAAKPITLQWAERPTGPWEHIGEPQMANTGTHNWILPANMPPRVYLRLTVRDAAGNTAVAETPQPIEVDLSEPESRIIGVVRSGRP